jgi:hypothetical protein
LYFFRVNWPKLADPELCESRRNDIRQGFLDGWNAYVENAWGADELNPVSMTESFWLGGQGTMVKFLLNIVLFCLLRL